MLRSMFAAVSGLQAHQTFMDVVGNNISNVNTTGFKAGTVEFEDLLSQTLNGAGLPTAARSAAARTRRRSASACASPASARTSRRARRSRPGARPTSRSRATASSSCKQGGAQAYTRNGSFSLDGLGQLVTGDGGLVQGWQADPQGNVNTNASTGPVKIPVGQTISPVTTANDQGRRQPARRLAASARRSTSRST